MIQVLCVRVCVRNSLFCENKYMPIKHLKYKRFDRKETLF